MTLRTRPRELEVKDRKFTFSEKAREESRKRPALNILRKSKKHLQRERKTRRSPSRDKSNLKNPWDRNPDGLLAEGGAKPLRAELRQDLISQGL